MAVVLRLMRIGRRRSPFYRIIAVDKRKKRDGTYIENIGTYNPLTEPAEIKLNDERFFYWKQQGAEISEGLQKLLKYQKRNNKETIIKKQTSSKSQ